MLETVLLMPWLIWVLGALACAFLFYCAETDNGLWATIVLVAGLGGVYLITDFNVTMWLYQNPLKFLICISLYFTIGVAWAVIKWFFYVKDQLKAFKACKKSFCEENRLDPEKDMPETHLADFKYYLNRNRIEYKPTPKNNKSRIYVWIAYWPWSGVWTLINDPVKRIVEFCYDCIVHTLESITARVWVGIEDLDKKKEVK